MAKCKLNVHYAASQSFGQIRKIMRKRLVTNIGFQERAGVTIYHKACKTKLTPSEAQLRWRHFYCICDSMYRHMTPLQKALWKRFYFKERYLGRTLRSPSQRKTKSYSATPSRHLSDYAYFMKKALTWNLKEYLRDYLNQDLLLLRLEVQDDKLLVEGYLTHELIVEMYEEGIDDFLHRYSRVRW